VCVCVFTGLVQPKKKIQIRTNEVIFNDILEILCLSIDSLSESGSCVGAQWRDIKV